MEIRRGPKDLLPLGSYVQWSRLIIENYGNFIHARTPREIKVLRIKVWVISWGKQPQPGNLKWVIQE